MRGAAAGPAVHRVAQAREGAVVGEVVALGEEVQRVVRAGRVGVQRGVGVLVDDPVGALFEHPREGGEGVLGGRLGRGDPQGLGLGLDPAQRVGEPRDLGLGIAPRRGPRLGDLGLAPLGLGPRRRRGLGGLSRARGLPREGRGDLGLGRARLRLQRGELRGLGLATTGFVLAGLVHRAAGVLGGAGGLRFDLLRGAALTGLLVAQRGLGLAQTTQGLDALQVLARQGLQRGIDRLLGQLRLGHAPPRGLGGELGLQRVLPRRLHAQRRGRALGLSRASSRSRAAASSAARCAARASWRARSASARAR